MAKELLLTGDTVDAHEAARIGLVGRVVKHDDLISECERIARKICLLPQIGVKLSKISIIICDHAARDILAVADSSIILSNGKVIAQGTPTQLMNNVTARNHYFGDSFKFN